MRTILCVLLVLTCVANVSAQHFDIWEYVLHPREEATVAPDRSSASAYATYLRSRLPNDVRRLVDDYLPMTAVKLALLSHYPSTNAVTQSLLSAVVPTGESVTDEVRYLAAFKRELQLDYPQLLAKVPEWAAADYSSFVPDDFYQLVMEERVQLWLTPIYKRAVQVVATMSRLETQHMADLAADVDFIRDSARVTRGEQNGFRLSAGRQNLYVKPESGDTGMIVAPLRSVDCRNLFWIGRGTAGSAIAHVIPSGGAVTVKVGSGADEAVRMGVLRTLTDAELGQGVRVTAIDAPTVTTHLSNQSVEQSTEQTVNYGGTFGGVRLTYSVVSSQPSVATVRLSEAGILVVRGVAAGNSTITLTASNESGNAVTTFVATVTPRSE